MSEMGEEILELRMILIRLAQATAAKSPAFYIDPEETDFLKLLTIARDNQRGWEALGADILRITKENFTIVKTRPEIAAGQAVERIDE